MRPDEQKRAFAGTLLLTVSRGRMIDGVSFDSLCHRVFAAYLYWCDATGARSQVRLCASAGLRMCRVERKEARVVGALVRTGQPHEACVFFRAGMQIGV